MAPSSQSPGSATDEGFDFYGAWTDYYNRMAEEGFGFFKKGLEMAQNMTPTPYPANDFFKLWMENYQDFLDRMQAQGVGSVTDPESYRKMYDLWLETWSHNLETYMRTPEFAAKSGKDLEAFSDLKKNMADTLETYWGSLHLPSSADMRELYQKLYNIERKLDHLDKRFRALEAAGQ